MMKFKYLFHRVITLILSYLGIKSALYLPKIRIYTWCIVSEKDPDQGVKITQTCLNNLKEFSNSC